MNGSSIFVIDVRGVDATGRMHTLSHAIPAAMLVTSKNPSWLLWYETRMMQRKITEHLCVKRLHWSGRIDTVLP